MCDGQPSLRLSSRLTGKVIVPGHIRLKALTFRDRIAKGARLWIGIKRQHRIEILDLLEDELRDLRVALGREMQAIREVGVPAFSRCRRLHALPQVDAREVELLGELDNRTSIRPCVLVSPLENSGCSGRVALPLEGEALLMADRWRSDEEEGRRWAVTPKMSHNPAQVVHVLVLWHVLAQVVLWQRGVVGPKENCDKSSVVARPISQLLPRQELEGPTSVVAAKPTIDYIGSPLITILKPGAPAANREGLLSDRVSKEDEP
mmetsp:Transcript_9975/g.25807  ORF Transcript_9975/g.25807 Transcript_9975/m.25807 type:complete len:262 (+) Transcript_9975:73-858(+)